jgi:hypothetical protein
MSSDEVIRLQERAAVIEHRLEKLEKPETTASDSGAKESEDKKDKWDKLQALGPLLTGVVLALLGYFLSGSLEQALKRQELQLSNVREMRQLVAEIHGGNITKENALADACTLSAFGAPSVGPLLSILSLGDAVRAPAAEKALRAVGLSEPQAVCAPLIRIIDNRSGQFNYLTHESALRLIGDLECRDALQALQRYQTLLQQMASPEKLDSLKGVMDQFPPLDNIAITQLKSAADRAMAIVGR